jgi:hypothetical protein
VRLSQGSSPSRIARCRDVASWPEPTADWRFTRGSVRLFRFDLLYRDGRGLGLRKARQTIVANARQFAVEIHGFRPHLRERFNYARIFSASIESRPRQRLPSPALDVSIQFDLMEPLRS